MTGVPIIVAREYLQRVRTKGFVAGTIGAPILLLGLVVVPSIIGANVGSSGRDLAVVDRTGQLSGLLVPQLEAGGFEVELIEGDDAEQEALERAREGDLPGVLVVDERTLVDGSSTFRGQEGPSALRTLSIQQAVNQSALGARLAENPDPGLAALLVGGELQIEPFDLSESQEPAGVGDYATGFVGALFLYFVLLIYGTMVLRAVLEEKTGRIAEVILSSVRPWELMLGKVLGVGAVGLTQLLVWVVSAVLILSTGLPSAIPFVADLDMLGDLSGYLPSFWVLGFFLVCFVLGYFIYSSLYAAVGAMCSTEEEAQQAQMPVMMLIIAPFLIMMPVLDSPDTLFAQVTSLFPFFSPIVMFGRVAVSSVPLWEIAVSVIGMILAVLATSWVAGRIYRVGILMQGKRPTLPELWRWVREA